MKHNDLEKWRRFFDELAPRWDNQEDLVLVRQKLQNGFKEMGVSPHENILDVGCGTGNLTLSVLPLLGEQGRVTAVDISPVMIRMAQEKISDSRVTLMVESSHALPIPSSSFHRIFCLHVWPHLGDYHSHLREFNRLLKEGGVVHVWHLVSRDTINAIHGGAGEGVKHDVLAPAEETAALFMEHGFTVERIIDDEERYLVCARKPGE
ncbi:class I SAM-dependent methyltransferase [Myxococcota bacterium]|nr:class I SAM-dependent methyltransferase [Myxococcota bacterium]MBU1537878.1 class I SAM-dependent methyltransferase [Myxococcota bacterium]